MPKDIAQPTPFTRISTERHEGYIPIGNHAVIGDTSTVGLIAGDGSLDWLCMPQFDGDAIFAELLDRYRGGVCRVALAEPEEGERTISRRYRDRMPILESLHETPQGAIKVSDAMDLPVDGCLTRGHRVLRLIEVTDGAPEIDITVAPRPNFGTVLPHLRKDEDGLWYCDTANGEVLIETDLPLERTCGGTLRLRQKLEPKSFHYLVITYTENECGPMGEGAAWETLERVAHQWEDKLQDFDYDGPYGTYVERSLITLLLLTHADTGAVVAAPTVGLPETIGGIRNYDYRYCWLRDAAFVLNAFLDLGFTAEGTAFFRWLMEASRETAPQLGTFYDIRGRSGPDPEPLTAYEGYRGSGPIIRGNDAMDQLQLDVYGSMLYAAVCYVDGGGTLSDSECQLLQGFARVVRDQWTLPDNGLWEMPGSRHHHTYSKAMCWSALDCYVLLCERGIIEDNPDPFRQEANVIKRTVLEDAWNEERGAFMGAIGGDWLDAAVLLLPRIGIIAADDPRMVSTFEAITDELADGPYYRRYADGVDGLDGTEGTFVVCGFWAADYLARAGRCEDAARQIDGMLEGFNDLGLMAEEYDPVTKQMLGNFPQGFSHAGMIAAAAALRDALAKRDA